MSKSNRFYVYIHRFRNGTLYVGKGSRRRAHQTSPGRHNAYWERLRGKYGSPRVRIVSSGLMETDSLALERDVINRLLNKNRRLCNRTLGGDGCLGMLVSDETRQRFSELNAGERNNMFGRTHTDEAKQRISRLNKGRFIGEKSGRYKDTVFHFIHEDGSTFSGTQWEFANRFKLSPSHTSMVCNKRKDSIKGWRLSSTPIEQTGRKGKRHGRYDHTVFHFRHDSGIEESCTKNELATKYNLPHPSNLTSLCKGKLPSYKGWRLIRR